MSKMTRRKVRRPPKQESEGPQAFTKADFEPDWRGTCKACGASPIVPITGMCGPCTFGEADTAGGNW
jgi:CO dehydrogenase/acetyl-CoA synthase alpha subunit